MNLKTPLLLITSCFFLAPETRAQSATGRENIDRLCGCFSVNFRYAETFSPDENYTLHDQKDMNAVELVLPIESTDRKVVMQHLLVIHDTVIIKHWREEWLYESTAFLRFLGDRKWVRETLKPEEVKNKWTQTVWEVSDEPRYQGVSKWITNDGKTYWESTVDAPLPRREYTIRDDYNIMKRRNRITLEDDGYIHEQDNDKISRKDGGDSKLIVSEKGFNTYYRLDDSECAVARTWWKKNGIFWAEVRNYWKNYLSQTPEVTLKTKVEDKMLHEHLFALWKDWNGSKVKTEELPVKIRQVIDRFQ